MAPGSLGLDSRILHELKTRALHLVRSSRDLERCLQVMRARAVAFFNSGDLGVAGKEESVEEGRDFVVRLESAPPLSMAFSGRESTSEPVEEPPVEDEVADENCSGFVSVAKIVPQLNVESKSFTVMGCTGGDVQGLSTCQENTLLLMDIRSEQNRRQSEEFKWQVKYLILIFTFDPGVLPYPSAPPLMPLDMRNEKFGKALGDHLTKNPVPVQLSEGQPSGFASDLAIVVTESSCKGVDGDSNKKQRTTPSRSADPAEAAVQPRQTQ